MVMNVRAAVALVLPMLIVLHAGSAFAEPGLCAKLLTLKKSSTPVMEWIKKKAVDKTLDLMAAMKGLPSYLKRNQELKTSGRYLKYANFGEMGLAEIGISARYDHSRLEALNTGRPLIIIANHHLGIADGLTLQYLAGQARPQSPTLLFLARWIEKIMPHAVFGDEHGWGTAVPVEINLPKESDPQYATKLAQVKAFNSSWTRNSFKVLREGGGAIIFPAGHVAAIEKDGGRYPESVYDAEGSWQEGFLGMARLGKADLVLAHVKSVNSEAFYRDRKRFGGGDKERVIWFFGEAIAKKGQVIDVAFSKPMGLEEVYDTLSSEFGKSRAELESDSALTAELMRRLTYRVEELYPQQFGPPDLPALKLK